jgi:hypothetical protein
LFIVKITLAAEVFAARAMEQSHSFSLWGGWRVSFAPWRTIPLRSYAVCVLLWCLSLILAAMCSVTPRMILGGEMPSEERFQISYCLPWGANSSYAAVFEGNRPLRNHLLRVETSWEGCGATWTKNIFLSGRRGWKRLENLMTAVSFQVHP